MSAIRSAIEMARRAYHDSTRWHEETYDGLQTYEECIEVAIRQQDERIRDLKRALDILLGACEHLVENDDEFDAVTWLRYEADACLSDMLEDTARKLQRAADEIKVLRKRVADLETALQTWESDESCAPASPHHHTNDAAMLGRQSDQNASKHGYMPARPLPGGQGVGGSNPLAPTIENNNLGNQSEVSAPDSAPDSAIARFAYDQRDK